MKLCSIEGCNNKHHAKGFCCKHRHRMVRYNNPFKEPRIPLSSEERILNIRRIKNKYKQTAKGKETTKRYVKGLVGRRTKNAATSLRRKRFKFCMPKWLSRQQREEIRMIYKNCPDGYEVDHIVPIKAVDENNNYFACGLHVPWNLQYLTKRDNQRKGNRIEVR